MGITLSESLEPSSFWSKCLMFKCTKTVRVTNSVTNMKLLKKRESVKVTLSFSYSIKYIHWVENMNMPTHFGEILILHNLWTPVKN